MQPPGGQYALTAQRGPCERLGRHETPQSPARALPDRFFPPTALANVARQTKPLPMEWVVDGNNLSQAYIDYAKPLVGPLPKAGKLSLIGSGEHARRRNSV